MIMLASLRVSAGKNSNAKTVGCSSVTRQSFVAAFSNLHNV